MKWVAAFLIGMILANLMYRAYLTRKYVKEAFDNQYIIYEGR